MNTTDFYKFLERQEKLRVLKDTLSKYELKLAELENARDVLSRHTTVYRILGGLMIEVSKEEAEEYIEKAERAFKAQIEKLKEEIEKVSRCS